MSDAVCELISLDAQRDPEERTGTRVTAVKYHGQSATCRQRLDEDVVAAKSALYQYQWRTYTKDMSIAQDQSAFTHSHRRQCVQLA